MAQAHVTRGDPIAPFTTSERIDRLLGEIVREIQSVPRDPQIGLNDDALLLDADIDGIRCILIRPAIIERGVRLSPREREIGRMVAKGYANKTIASVLDISAWTVGTHLRRIFAKLGVSTRAAMVAQLASEGFLGGHDVDRVS